MGMIYLDNAATTMIEDTVRDEIIRVLSEYNHNPSALYSDGFKAAKHLESSRKTIAEKLHCEVEEVYFTSGGTESNNIALVGSARVRKNFGNEIVVSGYEHPSVYMTLEALSKEGFKVHEIQPQGDGTVDIGEMLSSVNDRTVLVSAMQVNNEIGSIIDVVSLAKEVKLINTRTAFHSDMVQGFMKYPVDLKHSAIDTAAISAHKIHGPKGIGALYVRKGFHIEPIIHGGKQERGLRSGTENLAFASAFALASTIYMTNETTAGLQEINEYLRAQLKTIDGLVINSPNDGSAYILNFSLPSFKSETLLHFLDENGVLVSNGAACSKLNSSHTLLSMGLNSSLVESSIRVSFSKDTLKNDIDTLVELIKIAKAKLIRT
ncbi:MAG: cysteine desulfurase [Oscillospiraceae bacterium]|nr:cysteine desulfurase [Oscillospiraceae bacterium]